MTAHIATVLRCADLTPQVFNTLRSVERQAGGPGDIVLVADASTPAGAKEWLDRLAATRGHTFVDAPSDRPGVVRNHGVRATANPYVMCVDAGELLDPHCHEACSNVLAAKQASDAVSDIHLVTTSVLMLGPGSERRIVPDRPVDLDDLIGDTTVAHSASVFRRDTWDQLDGFDETLAALDDYELFLRLLSDGRRGAFIDRPLLIRTWRADGPYRRSWGSKSRFDAFRTIVEKHAERFAANPVAALIPRELHLHQTAGRYRELVARHNDARAEIERLTTEAGNLREHLPADLRESVTFGDLRRTSPIARDWGYERGTPIDRRYIEDFVEQYAADIRGSVLEVQEPDYTVRFGGNHVRHADVLDLNAGNSRATLIGDLRCAPNLPSETYDCVVFTQTLHVIDDMRAVIAECERILKPGGVLLATFPCASRVCLEYGYGGDFWRVTVDGARHLFAEVFHRCHAGGGRTGQRTGHDGVSLRARLSRAERLGIRGRRSVQPDARHGSSGQGDKDNGRRSPRQRRHNAFGRVVGFRIGVAASTGVKGPRCDPALSRRRHEVGRPARSVRSRGRVPRAGGLPARSV